VRDGCVIHDVAEMACRVLTKPPLNHSVIEFGGEDLSLLDSVVVMQEMLGRRIRVFHLPLGALRFVGHALRPFNRALVAPLEIVGYVEEKGLRADMRFLGEHPISLTSFRDFLQRA
jgi:hypothetical protein